jgi:iron uptake system EfeUOB component EfeO/EfeM
MLAPRRGTSLPAVATALVLSATVAFLVALAAPGTGSASAAARGCASHPTPGAIAPAGATVPASLAARYAVLRQPQRAADRLRPDQIGGSVSASGVLMSGTRFLGRAAFGGRVYLVPAEHLLPYLLAYLLAPVRCIPPAQRPTERVLRLELQREYRHPALCVDVLYPHSANPSCAAASEPAELALLSANGMPAFGLVPDAISAVTVTYQASPPRTVAVRRNFFAIVAPSDTAATACGVQWLDATGTVKKIVTGCSYLVAEQQALGEYRTYVAAKLSTLQDEVAALAAAIGAGNLAQAESDWLTAHLTWLDIGQDDGAYSCFGQLGNQIDGLAAGHPQGTSDPGFTGFHRVEFDLWTNDDLSAAANDTATLQNLLAELVEAPLSTYLPATSNGIANWLLRPHEVLEDADRDSLTANDDYGSGTDLASITADVAAVREMLTVLEPVLDPLAPHLVHHAGLEFDALVGAIDATRANGAWVSLQNLPTRQREQVDSDVGAALETLAPIPDLLTSTGRNAPST